MKNRKIKFLVIGVLLLSASGLLANKFLFQAIGINPNMVRSLDTNYVIHASRAARVYYTLNFSGTVNIATATAQTATAYLEFQYPWDNGCQSVRLGLARK